MKVLICGHRSFAARGLPEVLREAGHEVTCFSRGEVAARDGVVTGPIDGLLDNPHLAGTFDAVVNYVMLKDETVARNIAYIESLLRWCRERGVAHLVQISSVSSYKASQRLMDERSEIETDVETKGIYGAIKAATDLHIIAHAPPVTRVSLVRPGFILGKGLVNPIVGNALRLPWNRLLSFGNPQSVIPVISRELLHEAVARVLANPSPEKVETLILVAPHSPTRKAFLEACCRRLGCGTGVATISGPAWLGLTLASEAVSRFVPRPIPNLRARLPVQLYGSARTEQRLGMSLRFDWQAALQNAVDGQDINYTLPYRPVQKELSGLAAQAQRVTFLGFGRIVKVRHLPALEKLDFNGEVRAYDLRASVDPLGQRIEAIEGADLQLSDLFVIASPGPAHARAIEHLRGAQGPVLIEKPLCYNEDELEQWAEFAASHPFPVLACHNYRFKANVAQMLRHLSRFHTGELRHVSLHFESPSVSGDGALWLRDERGARTLLMDYALHFLDVACMFSAGQWRVGEVRFALNSQGQTSQIDGTLASDSYPVSFLLRQGFGPRRARLLFNFQNYSVSLGFFPDTFVAYMTDDNALLHQQEAVVSLRAMSRKLRDIIYSRDSDSSHAQVLGAAINAPSNLALGGLASSLTIERLSPFYRALSELGRRVYEPQQ